ncbi:hypothetical protein ACFQU2_06025 [Siccirubricoccus deserti]
MLTGPGTLHVSYVHSPMRYAWDLQAQYLRQAGLEHGLKGLYTRWLLHRLRLWDRSSAAGIDSVIGNSRYIAERIRKVWRREAAVIHPPVDVERFSLGTAPREGITSSPRAWCPTSGSISSPRPSAGCPAAS